MAPAPQTSNANGPQPGRIITSEDFICEQHIRQAINGVAKEEQHRLEGIALIESVRDYLCLPSQTFACACVFWHRFRIHYGKQDYPFSEAALTCLWFACKTEDTQKKSRDVACAAWNIANPKDQRTPDDKFFEKRSQIMHGMERMLLEILSFEVNCPYPISAMVTLMKHHLSKGEHEPTFYPVAWDMAFDMYKTFAPVKKTSWTLALSLLELTSRLTGLFTEKFLAIKPEEWLVRRHDMLETISDLLDLYTQNHRHTRLGALWPVDKFIDIKIEINKECEELGIVFGSWCKRCEHKGPLTPFSQNLKERDTKPENATKRFVFDRDAAREEQNMTRPYFEEEFEEYETEIEEEVTPEPERERELERPRERRAPSGPSGPRHGHGGRGGYGHGGHGFNHPRGGRHGGAWDGPRRRDNRRGGGGGGGGGGGFR